MRVMLTDGSSFFVSSKDRAFLGVAEGVEVSVSELSARAFRHALSLAEAKALEFLARREHTGREIAQKLEQRGFDSHVISECVAKLKDNDSIDETRFAEYYIESRLRKAPRGRMAIAAELQERGVPRGIVQSALSAYEQEHPGAFAEALRRALRKAGADGASPQRIAGRLSRRGFSAGEVQRALEDEQYGDREYDGETY